MLDAVAAIGIAGRVGGCRSFVGVERHPDPGIADGVDLHLPAAAVGLGDEGVEVLGVPLRAAGRGVVDVGIEHRGRPGLDDAVGECLEDAGVEPLPAAQVADEGLVAVERRAPVLERAARPHRQREPGPHPERTLVAEGPPQRESSGSTQASWIAVMPAACSSAIVRRIASSVDAVVGRGMCRVTSSWAPSLSAPVASPVAGSRTMTPSGGSAVSRSMPASRRAAVFAQPVWPSKQPMNAGRSGTTASSWRTVGMPPGNAMYSQPLPSTQGAARSAAACAAIAAWTCGDGVEPEQVDPVELVGTLAHVDVGVVEAGRDQAAARLDDLGPRSTPVAQAVVAAADPGDPSGSHARSRPLGPDRLPAGDEEAAADDQQVGGVAHQVTGDGRRPPVAPGLPQARP